MNLRHFFARCRSLARAAINAIIGFVAIGLFWLIRCADPYWSIALAGKVARGIGRYLPRHKIGLQNLAESFPEISDVEREKILRGVWENLGRTAAEYAHFDKIWRPKHEDDEHQFVEYSEDSLERFIHLRNQGKPALIFAAHLGNWEIPALVAAENGLALAVVFRRPNVGQIAEMIGRIRGLTIGKLISSHQGVAIAAARALEEGMHVAMLCDQHSVHGVPVVFFGRICKVNPLIARLANHFDAMIYGARAVRLENGHYRIELTEAMEAVRLADGKVDVSTTMQMITTKIEQWVREYPSQWLWLHQRWKRL